MLCNLQIFSGCVCHLEQLHAQSPFLFPIVFGINLMPFFYTVLGQYSLSFVLVCAFYLGRCAVATVVVGGFGSLALYIAQGRLRKNIRHPSCSQRQNCCHLKGKNTSTWSVLFAWSMPTKCCWVIYSRLTSEGKTSTSPLSFIPPLKRQTPCLHMLAWISVLQSALGFWHQRAHSSTWVDLLVLAIE